MSEVFYVYEHWRPDTDMCFYVGKGKGRRANVMYGRNEIHVRVQEKLRRLGMCVEVRLVMSGLTETEAHVQEIRRVAFWKAFGLRLANRTAGGEGASDPCEATRQKMRVAKLGRTLTEEHKAKIGAASREAAKRPGFKEKLSAAVRESHARPEVRAKLSAHQKAVPRTKEHYEKVAAALRGKKLSPEHVEASRLARIGLKQTSETIERRRAALIGQKRTEEHKAKWRASWTPERRAAQAERLRERMTPEWLAAQASRNVQYAKDPEWARVQSEKLKAAWVRRKQAVVSASETEEA